MPHMLTPLADHEAHIWHIDPARCEAQGTLPACEALLDSSERQRYARLRVPAVRVQYLVTRALVRVVLSRYAPVAPRDWRFAASAAGRPVIDQPVQPPGKPLYFNVSHTDGLVACAVARLAAIGVDVEPSSDCNSRITEEITKQFVTPDEFVTIGDTDPRVRPHLLLRLWTLKEAYGKARGVGLNLPLRQITFNLSSDEAPSVAFGECIEDDSALWHFAQFDPTPSHILAVALRFPDICEARIRLKPATPADIDVENHPQT